MRPLLPDVDVRVSAPLPMIALLLTALSTSMLLLAVSVTLPAFSRLTKAAGVITLSEPVLTYGPMMVTEPLPPASPYELITALPDIAPLSTVMPPMPK